MGSQRVGFAFAECGVTSRMSMRRGAPQLHAAYRVNVHAACRPAAPCGAARKKEAGQRLEFLWPAAMSGAPSGIRTRDIHLERVASWAARRWGRRTRVYQSMRLVMPRFTQFAMRPGFGVRRRMLVRIRCSTYQSRSLSRANFSACAAKPSCAVAHARKSGVSITTESHS